MQHVYSIYLKFGYFVFYKLIYRFTERKYIFMYTTVHADMVGAQIAYVLGLLVHGKVVVEFGRKVFLVDCLL